MKFWRKLTIIAKVKVRVINNLYLVVDEFRVQVAVDEA